MNSLRHMTILVGMATALCFSSGVAQAQTDCSGATVRALNLCKTFGPFTLTGSNQTLIEQFSPSTDGNWFFVITGNNTSSVSILTLTIRDAIPGNYCFASSSHVKGPGTFTVTAPNIPDAGTGDDACGPRTPSAFKWLRAYLGTSSPNAAVTITLYYPNP